MYFIALALIGMALWTAKFFGRVSVDQALSTFYFDLNGAMVGNAKFARRFMEWVLFWPAVLALAIMLAPRVLRAMKELYGRCKFCHGIRVFFANNAHMILFVIGLAGVCYQYRVADYIVTRMKPAHDYFAENYVSPATVAIKAKHPKSLLFIYVESLETTYSNQAIFNNDLLHGLTKLPENHVAFSRLQQMPGTGWSIAGIVSTQCGLPLKLLTMLDHNAQAQGVRRFLPNVMCLGDVLKQYGYKNIYMNGSDVNFAGVAKFLRDHSYDEMYGRDYWVKSGRIKAKDLTAWGLPDDLLLEQAKVRLKQLVDAGQPFNLTLFTIDTHGVSGQLSPTCARKGFNDFPGIVECTSNMVGELIAYCQEQGWLKNMNIVVMGDHLAMENTVSNKLKKAKHRYVFNEIISDQPLQKQTDYIDHFDMFPTILASLGFNITGERLGLGYVRIGKSGVRSSPAYFKKMESAIPYQSDTYNRMWAPTN